MTTRIHSLVIALRVAYGASLGSFALAVVVAFAAATTSVGDDGSGGLQIVFDLPDDSPAGIALEWMALSAFAFAAIGALLTVLARVSAPEPVDEH